MLKLTGFDVLLAVAGNLYLLLTLAGVCIALWKGKTRQTKLLMTVLVLVMFLAPIAPEIYRQVEYRNRLATAKAMFAERCKTAEEKIYRTVENVEGVLLLNIRQPDMSGDHSDPMWPDAALAHESSGEWYVRMFLFNEYDGSPNDKSVATDPRGFISIGVSGNTRVLSRGYSFVDVKQSDGSILRYRLKDPNKSDLEREFVKGKPARYAVSFVNQVRPEDRAQWIAGTTITVTDMQTNEVLATRESYSFEPGFGSRAGGRQPWVRAETCPSFHGSDGARTRFFVDQILKPKQGE